MVGNALQTAYMQTAGHAWPVCSLHVLGAGTRMSYSSPPSSVRYRLSTFRLMT
jgi:hypothetical protein